MKLLNKLRVQLVLWTVTLEAILLLVFALILVFALQNSLSQQIDETLRLSAAQMNAVVDVALDNGVSRYEIPAEDTAALRGRGVMVWILDPSGTIVATVGEAADIPLPVSLPLPGTFADTLLSDDQAGRLFALPLQEGNRAFGTLVLATSLRSVQTFMRDVLLSLAIALPLVLMLSAAGGLFLANRALSPVASITATVRHISADDLSQRIHLNTQDDEIGQLANTFDAMLERLQNAFQRERQLTSDVSHELRTPLGLLKTQLSLARSRPREAAELLQMMRDMEDDVDRMTRLVEQLLTLARLEQRGIQHQADVDVSLVVEAVISQFQGQATAHRINLTLTCPQQVNVTVKGETEALFQVFANLVENAIKYTEPDGFVGIEIVRLWDEISVAVINSGEGIAPEHLPHLFERFYRADSARARQTGGFGLGLAIANALVQSHHGSITAASQPGHQTTFTVTLPVNT